MIQCERKNLQWLQFALLQSYPEVVHGIFLKPLDVSIEENQSLLCEALGVPHFISKKQVHGDVVAHVPDADIFECDGLITQESNQGLLIKHADCQAAIFFDPVQKAIGNIHCGWRGSVKNIYAKTVAAFEKHFGSKREDLLVCISPSLGPSKGEFIHHERELPKKFKQFEVMPNYFDFWEISKQQLLDVGVLEKRIEIAEMCTYTQENFFFSYRRDKKTARHGTLAALKDLGPVSSYTDPDSKIGNSINHG